MRGLIFDMDGVLLDTHPAHLNAWRCLLAEAGRPVSESELEFVLDGHKRREIIRHFLGDLDECGVAYYDTRKDEYFARFADSVQPLPGIPEFIDSLQRAGLPAAVATSAGRSRTEALLNKFGLQNRFSAIITGDEVRNGKPDPAIFLLAASRLGLRPEDLIVVEDAVSGVRAALGAGMRCIGIADHAHAGNLLAAGAQFVIPDFQGLLPGTLRELFNANVLPLTLN